MNQKSGFTFLEILVAMLIICILSGVVGLSLYQYVRKAKVEAALPRKASERAFKRKRGRRMPSAPRVAK